jgi:trimethylamine-N-oxide reductase (cytochrome c)
MIATHSRYSFHTHADGKRGATNEITDHRIAVAGHYFWLARMNDLDARERGVRHGDLIKVWNERSAVICAADVSPMVARGTVKSFESSAEYEMIEVAGEWVEIGGCMNTLTPSRSQSQGTSSMAPNSCLVQVEAWRGAAEFTRMREARASAP